MQNEEGRKQNKTAEDQRQIQRSFQCERQNATHAVAVDDDAADSDTNADANAAAATSAAAAVAAGASAATGVSAGAGAEYR